MNIAERGLLPAVRAEQADTLIIADGFNCNTQIEKGAERSAIHIGQVLGLNSPEAQPS